MSKRAAVDHLEEAQKAVKQTEAQLAEVDKQIAETADTSQRQHEIAGELAKLSAVLSEQHQQQSAWEIEVAGFRKSLKMWAEAENNHLDYVVSHAKGVQTYREQLAHQEKRAKTFEEQVQYLELWEKGFGNQGVKSLVFDTVTPFLNEHGNEYLRVLSGGNATVEFTTQTELASGEKRDKFDVQVSYKHGFDDYKGVSGGEGHRVDVAAMFALGDLSASRARAAVRLRLLDEPFDNLDALGKERVFELLRDVLAPKVGTLLVMSHDDYLTARFENRLTVVKEGGISRIES
jgi:DNA repair exonuclease SbcCD ATPase subunit